MSIGKVIYNESLMFFRQGAVVFQREAGAGGDLIKDLPPGTAIQDGHTGQRTD